MRSVKLPGSLKMQRIRKITFFGFSLQILGDHCCTEGSNENVKRGYDISVDAYSSQSFVVVRRGSQSIPSPICHFHFLCQ